MAQRPVVLIVDDDPSIRLLCRVNLELDGFTVREASNLAEAREHLEDGEVEVAVLDVHVGTEDGRDLVDELRARDAHVRVLMLTGTADLTTTRFDAADAVMAKPFEPAVLIRTVRELVARRERVGNGDSVA